MNIIMNNLVNQKKVQQSQDVAQPEQHTKNESIVSEFVFDPDPNFLMKINKNINENVVIK